MSTGMVAAIVVAVLIVIAIIAVVAMSRGGGPTGSLKHRFGPEYDRTLAQHDGDVKATRKELSERVKRYGGLERGALSEDDRAQYTNRWTTVQAHFVEDPGQAVNEADRLIADVAQNRGFPAAGSPEHYDALSVHHAHQVQGYRQAHALAEHAGAGGRKSTEDLRQALVSSRELFNELLTDEPKSKAAARREDEPEVREVPAAEPAPEAAAEPEARSVDADPDPDPDADADPSTDPGTDPETGAREHRPLGKRFAALTGGGRKDQDRDHDTEQP
jgi:hypothetical protein